MKQYATVFIDWSQTLSYSKFWGHWEDKSHPSNPIFQSIQRCLFFPPSEIVNKWMRGDYTSEQIVKQLSNELEVDYEFLLRELIKSCKEMKFSAKNIREGLVKLKRKNIRLILATDNMDNFTRWTVPALKLSGLFDDILNSYDLRILKEDMDSKGKSIFFEKYLSQHDYLREECVVIDDGRELEMTLKKSGIDYLQVTKERPLSYHLNSLVNLSLP